MKTIHKNNKMVGMRVRFSIFLFACMFLFQISFADEGTDSITAISQNNCEGLFANNFDAGDNLISSVMGLCLPGVINNLGKLEETECEKILCEYKAAKDGLSPIGCAKQSAYNTCLITGQGYQVVEGMLIGSLRETIRNVLENPLGLGIELAKKYLNKQVKQKPMCEPNCSTPTSKIAAIALAGIELSSSSQTLSNLKEEFSQIYDPEDSACEQLEKIIRPDLEKVVSDYKESQGG